MISAYSFKRVTIVIIKITSRRMQSQGLSMDQYFQFTGMTADKMMEDMKPQALKRIQTRLVDVYKRQT